LWRSEAIRRLVEMGLTAMISDAPEGSSVLVVVLTATQESTGHVQVEGKWTTVTVIELSKEEFADWEACERRISRLGL
jgi:hypothetical protein